MIKFGWILAKLQFKKYSKTSNFQSNFLITWIKFMIVALYIWILWDYLIFTLISSRNILDVALFKWWSAILKISHWRTIPNLFAKKPLQQTAVSTSVQELENTSTTYWARPTLSQLFFSTKGIKMRDLFKTFTSNECRGAKNGIKTSLTYLFSMDCLKESSETWYEVYCLMFSEMEFLHN